VICLNMYDSSLIKVIKSEEDWIVAADEIITNLILNLRNVVYSYNWSMTPPSSIFNGLPFHQGFYLVTELDDCKLDAMHEKLSVFTFPLLHYEASAIGLICKLLDFQGQGLAYGMSWCDMHGFWSMHTH